jgi:hypothetical protein
VDWLDKYPQLYTVLRTLRACVPDNNRDEFGSLVGYRILASSLDFKKTENPDAHVPAALLEIERKKKADEPSVLIKTSRLTEIWHVYGGLHQAFENARTRGSYAVLTDLRKGTLPRILAAQQDGACVESSILERALTGAFNCPPGALDECVRRQGVHLVDYVQQHKHVFGNPVEVRLRDYDVLLKQFAGAEQARHEGMR